MFTGIVTAVGRVAALERQRTGARLQIAGAGDTLRRLRRGDSIAVNGCCLTIIGKRASGFVADLTEETLERTNLGGLAAGARVNLEAPLRMGDALSGHMVQGHVEDTGRIVSISPDWLEVEAPAALLRHIVAKGSITVDGISLTVAKLRGRRLGFAIIPHTFRQTNLRVAAAGGWVNIETDPMARQIEQFLRRSSRK